MFQVQISRAVPAAIVAALWLISACNWQGLGARPDPPTTSVAPAAALPLEVGNRTHGRIDCDGGHCVRRYELELHSHGDLLIRVEPQITESGDGLRAILEDPAENVLDRKISDESGRPVEVGASVRPGRYSLLLQSRSGELDYTLIAVLQTHEAPMQSARHADPVALRQPLVPAGRNERLEQSGSSLRGVAKNPQIHFGDYRHYSFAQNPAQELNAAPGSYIGNPFIDEQIQRAIRYQLADSGFNEVAAEQAQFLVSMHTGSSAFAYYTISGVAYNTTYSTWFDTWGGYGYVGGPWNAALHTEGTLVIDIIDIASKELVWHGWATETTGWQDNDVVIRKAVNEILSKFP